MRQLLRKSHIVFRVSSSTTTVFTPLRLFARPLRSLCASQTKRAWPSSNRTSAVWSWYPSHQPTKSSDTRIQRSIATVVPQEASAQFPDAAQKSPFQCPKCHKTFASKGSLSAHQHRFCEVERPPRPHVCPGCNRTFASQRSLQSHRQSACSVDQPSSGTPLECARCGNKYSNKHTFYDHVCPGRRFECAVCRKNFLTQVGLSRHEPLHDPERQHACHCGLRYKTKEHLRTHQRRQHESAGPVKCPSCETQFADISYLRRHIAVSHSRNVFKCSHCDYETKYTINLKRHNKNLHATADAP